MLLGAWSRAVHAVPIAVRARASIDDPYDAEHDAEHYELTYPKLKWGLRKLQQKIPDEDACPMLAHASQHHTRPCP